MEELKKAVLLAAKLREDSWDGVSYLKSIAKASDEAAGTLGFDLQATTPIHLLLSNCWNDALAWAEN